VPRLDFYADYELFVKVKLEASETSIGRSPDCTVQLPDNKVSRVHAVIRPTADGYELDDRSSNGTRVNDNAVQGTVQLAPDDRIYIERFIIIYQPDTVAPVQFGDTSTELA
jgi:pSer/pThr/pTyr-binding forkhead associated (FHA) protein